MSSTITQTSIINRGLQILGYKPVGSINDNDRGARAMNRAYQPTFLNVLRSNFWSFAITRAILAASATQPAFGKANYFPLPGDFIMLAPPDQSYGIVAGGGLVVGGRGPSNNTGINDWQIENMGGQLAIASDDQGPLYIRYVTDNITTSMFDPCFAEAFSAALAIETCEELTQSNTKLQNAEGLYKDAIAKAKQRNAFEARPVRPPIDTYILVRI